MAEILQDISWAIYCDGDTLWTGDISKLWNLRDDRYILQASVEPPKTSDVVGKECAWYDARGLPFDRENYCCMGLMMMNLAYARREKVAQKCRDFIARFPDPRTVDQTVLNSVCLGKIKPLPAQWGVLSFCHRGIDLTQDALIHYANDLPWRRNSIGKLNSDVVLLWAQFAKSIGEFTDVVEGGWRRWLFLLLKYNQWILKTTVELSEHDTLRNTCGLSKCELSRIRERLHI